MREPVILFASRQIKSLAAQQSSTTDCSILLGTRNFEKLLKSIPAVLYSYIRKIFMPICVKDLFFGGQDCFSKRKPFAV